MYWDGDKTKIENVARLAADLLPEPTDQAEALFVARYDASSPSAGVQYRLGQKFSKCDVWPCDRRATGFPGGCNEMAYGLLNYVYIQRHMKLKFQDITTILMLEGDCVITRPTWVEELCADWESAYNYGKRIVGAVQKAIPEIPTNEHINAVAMYDPEILRLIPQMIGGPEHIGWDNYHGPRAMPFAKDSPLFKLDYKRETITEDELYRKPSPLIYHGVKDLSALMAVRNHYHLNETK
jgi:hypothetical protein